MFPLFFSVSGWESLRKNFDAYLLTKSIQIKETVAKINFPYKGKGKDIPVFN